jgi:hypothetical protein
MVIADINVGILYVFAIASLGVYGIVLGGWASNSKYPFLGGVRSSSQMISYELSLGLAVIPVFLLVGNLRLTSVVQYQIEHGWLIAPFVGDWSNLGKWLLTIPMIISFVVFMVAVFAETNRLPFDLPEAEQELAGGYHTEYSSMKFALFFLGEYAAMICDCGYIIPGRLAFPRYSRWITRLDLGFDQHRDFLRQSRRSDFFHDVGALDPAALSLGPVNASRLAFLLRNCARQYFYRCWNPGFYPRMTPIIRMILRSNLLNCFALIRVIRGQF